MSLIGLAMNVLLAMLLLAALMMGWRLNRRLKALRDSHEGFAAAVIDLNTAAARAEQGLADLRAATDEAVDLLADRIDKGRSLAMKLERLVEHANVPQRAAAAPTLAPTPDDPVAERRLGALLAAAREMRPERAMPPLRGAAAPDRVTASERSVLERQIARARRLAEDDLFDDEPLTLDDVRGARR
jgi:5S rRNA maturation endonuclease (ribonuclease M5)